MSANDGGAAAPLSDMLLLSKAMFFVNDKEHCPCSTACPPKWGHISRFLKLLGLVAASSTEKYSQIKEALSMVFMLIRNGFCEEVSFWCAFAGLVRSLRISNVTDAVT